MDTTTEYAHILYEVPEAHIARIVLNRPDTANAQDTRFLYELNDFLMDPSGLPEATRKALGVRLERT